MRRITESERGVYVICATPFLADGRLDVEGTAQLVDFYLGCKVDGLTILGVMGEANKMTEDEAEAYVERVIGCVSGRVPVVVGVTHTALEVVARLTATSMDLGAAGVMLQPLQGLKGDAAIHRYFGQVLERIGPDVPVIYQDFPQASGVHLSVEIWNRMADDYAQLVMLKHEDVPGLAKLTRIREAEREPGRRRVSILVGNNGLFLPQELKRGADGAMTGFAYPDVLAEVCTRFSAGDESGATDLFDRYLPLNRYEQQPGFGLAVRKEILFRRGALRSATARAPAYRLTATDRAEIESLMERAARGDAPGAG